MFAKHRQWISKLSHYPRRTNFEDFLHFLLISAVRSTVAKKVSLQLAVSKQVQKVAFPSMVRRNNSNQRREIMYKGFKEDRFELSA